MSEIAVAIQLLGLCILVHGVFVGTLLCVRMIEEDWRKVLNDVGRYYGRKRG